MLPLDRDIFHEDTIFHGTKALIRIQDKIIVVRRDSKLLHAPLGLDLPGGGREDGESPFKTIQREIREILGIQLHENDIVYAVRYEHIRGHDDDTFFMVATELDVQEKDIIWGEKGLMYNLMTLHEFVTHPEVVPKQRDRVCEYLDAVQNELTKVDP